MPVMQTPYHKSFTAAVIQSMNTVQPRSVKGTNMRASFIHLNECDIDIRWWQATDDGGCIQPKQFGLLKSIFDHWVRGDDWQSIGAMMGRIWWDQPLLLDWLQ